MRNRNTERELDALLAQWAERNALPSERASAIRLTARTSANVLSTATGPGSDWWKDLFRGVSRAVRLSTDARRYLPMPAHPIARPII